MTRKSRYDEYRRFLTSEEADRIRTYLDTQELSQEDFARLLGVKRETVTRILNRGYKVGEDLAYAMYSHTGHRRSLAFLRDFSSTGAEIEDRSELWYKVNDSLLLAVRRLLEGQRTRDRRFAVLQDLEALVDKHTPK